MQAATGAELDSLISAQKEIISATWNLERRSNAGRSATDIEGVADAQAELKTRAERAAGASGPRRRIGRMPPAFAGGFDPARFAAPPQAPAADDPVRTAVDAMARALQQLQTKKTAEAIPHEMAALNALLQAQAEVRRRQVSQQRSGGSGFGNRQTQDLSNLFDRELKRQQRTNYETTTDVEAGSQSASTDSALDKIRDLAKRQEDLNRQQRELGRSSLSAEEMKQHIETLTREQEELRQRQGPKQAALVPPILNLSINVRVQRCRGSAEGCRCRGCCGARGHV